jgi:hypothetical protein
MESFLDTSCEGAINRFIRLISAPSSTMEELAKKHTTIFMSCWEYWDDLDDPLESREKEK